MTGTPATPGDEPTLVRPARDDDVAAVAAIADAKRHQRARQQPRFWNPAPDAVERHTPYLAGLVDDPGAVFLVAESGGQVTGFAIGRLGPAPPVYEPGGDTCVVDDAALLREQDWPTVGDALLDRVRAVAEARGAVQLVVVAGLGDEAQSAVLSAAGLSVASQWWVGPTQR